MTKAKDHVTFTNTILIIGVNPHVIPPPSALEVLFQIAGRNKGPIPVRIVVDGHPFQQTLVHYAGDWRLYLNGPMLKATKKKVGDRVRIEMSYEPDRQPVPMPEELKRALTKNKAALREFQKLAPSLRLEIVRYIARLKNPGTVTRNTQRAIDFLLGKGRFVGRDKHK